MYAIVKTGGKQYRVERGQSLLVERLPESDGATVALQPLLYVDGADVLDGDDLSKVKISARIVGHERGPKLRIVKFKPKRGYKRRTGHRQELTRLEVTEIKLGPGRAARSSAKAAADAPPSDAAETKAPARAKAPAHAKADAPASEAAETKAPARASRARAKAPASAHASDPPVSDAPASDPPVSDPSKEGGDGA